MTSNDPRQVIPTAGFRRLFIKSRTHLGREVTAVAYRNNGNVTLGMTTIYSDNEWDLVLERPTDKGEVRDSNWKWNSLLKTALKKMMRMKNTLTDAIRKRYFLVSTL